MAMEQALRSFYCVCVCAVCSPEPVDRIIEGTSPPPTIRVKIVRNGQEEGEVMLLPDSMKVSGDFPLRCS